MSFVDMPSEDGAQGRAVEMFVQSKAANGYLPNMVRLFAHRPDVFEAWVALNSAIKSNMDLRRYELVTLAAAQELKSSYCMLAHGKVMLGGMVSPEQLALVVAGSDQSPLNEAERAVMRFARKVARDATSIDQSDVDALRACGLSDAEIFDVTTAASVRCFFSKTLDALGALPDAAYAALPETVRDALVVGRPIETKGSGAV